MGDHRREDIVLTRGHLRDPVVGGQLVGGQPKETVTDRSTSWSWGP